MYPVAPKHIFIVLCTLFIFYTASIYIQPSNYNHNKEIQPQLAGKGKLVWQKYNCQSCHQLYGLGGYLGPDLTNIYSHPEKRDLFIRTMLQSGIRQMPAFELREEEILALLEFLKSTDASGNADPRRFNVNEFGLTEINEN